MRWLLASLLLLAASPAFAQDPRTLAQQRFEEGLALHQNEQHEEALTVFREANEIYASPNTRLMIARSLRALDRLAEAWGEYRLTAAQARDLAPTDARYERTIVAASNEGGELTDRIARLRVTLEPTPEEATVEVQGRSYPAAALADDIPVDPGAVMVHVRAPGFLDAQTQLELAAGDDRTVRLTLEAAPEPPPLEAADDAGPWEALGFTFGGLAVVGAVLWPVFYALADARFGEARAMCPMGTSCPPSTQPLIDEGQSFEAATNASWITALSATALSVTFFLLAWL